MLENILKYQDIESQILSLENDLAKSTDRAKASEIQQVLKNQHSKLIEIEDNAKKINLAYQKAVKKFEEYSKKLIELEKETEKLDSEKIPAYEKIYKDFVAVSNVLEKEIMTLNSEVQQTSMQYEEIMKKSKTDRERFDKYKIAYNKLKSEKEPEINKLKEELLKNQSKLDKGLYDLYLQKRDSKIFPVFVPLNLNKCGGCRMEVSASKIGQMKNEKYGIIECENCGRFIFNK